MPALIVGKELLELGVGPVAVLSLLVFDLIEETAEGEALVDIDHFDHFNFSKPTLLGLLPDLLGKEGLINFTVTVHIHTAVQFQQPF